MRQVDRQGCGGQRGHESSDPWGQTDRPCPQQDGDGRDDDEFAQRVAEEAVSQDDRCDQHDPAAEPAGGAGRCPSEQQAPGHDGCGVALRQHRVGVNADEDVAQGGRHSEQQQGGSERMPLVQPPQRPNRQEHGQGNERPDRRLEEPELPIHRPSVRAQCSIEEQRRRRGVQPQSGERANQHGAGQSNVRRAAQQRPRGLLPGREEASGVVPTDGQQCVCPTHDGPQIGVHPDDQDDCDRP